MQYQGTKQILSVIGNELALSSFGVGNGKRAVSVSIDGEDTRFEQRGASVHFARRNVRMTLVIETEEG